MILNSLSPVDQLTLRMFGDERAEKFRQVMVAVDRINRRWGKDTVRFAVANPEGRWSTKFEQRSPRYRLACKKCLRYPERDAAHTGLIMNADAEGEGATH